MHRQDALTLDSLPCEILELILYMLTGGYFWFWTPSAFPALELSCARLVNRRFHQCAMRTWAQHYLHQLHTDLTSLSIEKLQWLAEKTQLNQHVREVAITRPQEAKSAAATTSYGIALHQWVSSLNHSLSTLSRSLLTYYASPSPIAEAFASLATNQ